MSKIVHKGSAEVQDYKMGAGGMRLGSDGRKFSTNKIDGTFSKIELDQACERARAEGLRQGIQEAEKRLTAPLKSALENLETILDDLSKFRRELFKEAEKEVIELVRFISKKVLRKELSLDESLLKSLVEKALEIVEREKLIVIAFSPSDLKIFESAKVDFLKRFSESADLRYAPDPQVQAGTTLIRTETTQVDISVDKMVDVLLAQVAQSKISDQGVNDDESGDAN